VRWNFLAVAYQWWLIQTPALSILYFDWIVLASNNSSRVSTHWYKQSVYDPSDAKVGEIMDVLVDHDGKIAVLIVGVGGFLGVGEKDVAVPFNAVQFKTKDNNKWSANPSASALEATCRQIRRTATWLPTVAELLKVLREQMEFWADQLGTTTDDVEYWCEEAAKKIAAFEARSKEAAAVS
jgi:sporulation protein YlmC with PRC-barrel domain